ncbi:anthocyanidin 3-O-glucosyltransferase 2-like [Lycium ferocissimum]|uniref:anthocyanidin 3-O-glucosyltransferase 2-like n=1 Tax=Lycium ferocissimum TaxID=112874 RepID=UPI00281580D2|nr:anthocyanidin 3-O-glucosyltransferase 2-like [Lycium ferocissimum]
METKAELVFIPSPGLGHVASAVEISKLILDTDERLCISLLIMKHPADFGVQPYLQSLPSHPRLHFVDISIDPKIATELLSNKDRFLYDFIDGHKSKVSEFVRNNITSTTRLAGFVLDMFCISMIDVANEFGVPSYIFFTSGTAFLALSLHFEALRNDEDATSKYDYSESNEELSILGFKNPYPAKILPRPAKSVTPSSILYFEGIRRFKETKGIIINTFAELEPFALQSLKDAKIAPPIYPIRPVVSSDDGNKKEETENIVKWLDEQPNSSVIFLCFGTLGSFEPDQVKEIAIALERSGHRFLWSLRRPPPKGKVEMPSNYDNSEEILPEGFLDRTKGVGKVVGWTPQVTVLSHPAVGGFVSHCGWNSTVESVCCGVPIAAWPLYAEQQMNAFLLVKELGLAVEIRMDYVKDFEGKNPVNIVSAEEIEGAIRKLMVDSEENEVRKRMKEMQEKSNIAMEEGGSSYTSLRLLIEDFISNIS